MLVSTYYITMFCSLYCTMGPKNKRLLHLGDMLTKWYLYLYSITNKSEMPGREENVDRKWN